MDNKSYRLGNGHAQAFANCLAPYMEGKVIAIKAYTKGCFDGISGLSFSKALAYIFSQKGLQTIVKMRPILQPNKPAILFTRESLIQEFCSNWLLNKERFHIAIYPRDGALSEGTSCLTITAFLRIALKGPAFVALILALYFLHEAEEKRIAAGMRSCFGRNVFVRREGGNWDALSHLGA